MKTNKSLGEKLKELRELKGNEAKDLAEYMCVGKSAVSNWEADRRIPDIIKISKIAEYYGVSVDYLSENSQTGVHTADTVDDEEFKNLYKQYTELNLHSKEIVEDLIKTLIEKQKDK